MKTTHWIPLFLLLIATPGCRSLPAATTGNPRPAAPAVKAARAKGAKPSRSPKWSGKVERGGMSMPPRVSALMVTLYVSHAQEDELYLLPVVSPVKEVSPLQALRALAALPEEGDSESPLPPGTKVLGLKVDPSGTAVADFSREIVSRFQGGGRREQILLSAVADTLTEFPTIQRVEVRVEGKQVDSIGGHVDLSEPLERDMEFVLPPHPSMPCGGRKGGRG